MLRLVKKDRHLNSTSTPAAPVRTAHRNVWRGPPSCEPSRGRLPPGSWAACQPSPQQDPPLPPLAHRHSSSGTAPVASVSSRSAQTTHTVPLKNMSNIDTHILQRTSACACFCFSAVCRVGAMTPNLSARLASFAAVSGSNTASCSLLFLLCGAAGISPETAGKPKRSALPAFLVSLMFICAVGVDWIPNRAALFSIGSSALPETEGWDAFGADEELPAAGVGRGGSVDAPADVAAAFGDAAGGADSAGAGEEVSGAATG
jgi:hypothetical protein